MTLAAEDLSYKARALAQTHALTPLAKRFVDEAVAEQRTSQPVSGIGIWAGAALLVGYCLRRVEEVDAGLNLSAGPAVDVDLATLDEQASRAAAELRTGGFRDLLGEEERTLAALDNVISREVGKRLDQWLDEVNEKAVAELEEYITWWVVKGYALRVAESTCGALAAADAGGGAGTVPA